MAVVRKLLFVVQYTMLNSRVVVVTVGVCFGCGSIEGGKECFIILAQLDVVFSSGYACARHKDILVKGKLLVTENWICFYSSIMGWETKV